MLMIGLQVVLILLKICLQILKKNLVQKVGVVELFLFSSCTSLQEFKSVLPGFRLFPELKRDPNKLFKYNCKSLEIFKEQLLFFFFF